MKAETHECSPVFAVPPPGTRRQAQGCVRLKSRWEWISTAFTLQTTRLDSNHTVYVFFFFLHTLHFQRHLKCWDRYSALKREISSLLRMQIIVLIFLINVYQLISVWWFCHPLFILCSLTLSKRHWWICNYCWLSIWDICRAVGPSACLFFHFAVKAGIYCSC